jgi:hypothetical protein
MVRTPTRGHNPFLTGTSKYSCAYSTVFCILCPDWLILIFLENRWHLADYVSQAVPIGIHGIVNRKSPLFAICTTNYTSYSRSIIL